MEDELSTEVDIIISILRSNPGQKFDFAALHALTKIPIPYLKKWVDMLEVQGHVQISYNITREEFCWVGEGKKAKKFAREHVKDERRLSGMIPIPLHKKYSREDVCKILDRIKAKQGMIEKMKARQKSLFDRKAVDSATYNIMEIQLEKMTHELARMLRQARRVSHSASKA